MKRFLLLIALLSSGWIYANHWTPVSGSFEDNMTLTGVIQIDGVEQQATTLEVGVFCGAECRGSALSTYFLPTQRYVVQLTIYGAPNDSFTFKLYDHELGREIPCESPNAITFAADGYGTLSSPYVLAFIGLGNACHWTPESGSFEDNMTLTGIIQIEGDEQQTSSLEVGVFCGTQCRGTSRPTLFPPTQRYVVQLTIFGTPSEQFTFKLYDHELEQELDLDSPQAIAFNSNGYGSLSNPYVLNFTEPIPLPTFYTFVGSVSDSNWSTPSNWEEGIVPIVGSDVYINGECTLDVNATVDSLSINDEFSLTISQGKTLVTNKLVSDDASNLFIEDGGQLFTSTSNAVKATVNIDITGYGSEDASWYLISPGAYALSQQRIKTNTTGMLNGAYDLYTFDVTMTDEEWQNAKEYAITYLYIGKGYLYAHQTNTTLSFSGTLVTTSSETFELDYNSAKPTSSFNLVGNPFPCNATVDTTYYRLGDDHQTLEEGIGPIKPCEAVFVRAESQGDTVTFTRVVP